MDGLDVGSEDGWDVGQSETDGWADGLLLGGVLVDGIREGFEDGCHDAEGAWLGTKLGWDEGVRDGWPVMLGLSLGMNVGQLDTEGVSDGCFKAFKMKSQDA